MEDFDSSMRARRSQDEPWLLSYADLITNLLIFFVALLSAMDVSRVKMQDVQQALAGKVETKSLKQLEHELKSHIEQEGYQEVISATKTDRGVIVALNSGIVFPLGSAAIAPKFKQILADVMVKTLNYADKYEFAIEGHTDQTPVIKGGLYHSNWELGSARALIVREHLEAVGIPRTHLHVEAYADTRPLMIPQNAMDAATADDLNGRQRRVIIRIY